ILYGQPPKREAVSLAHLLLGLVGAVARLDQRNENILERRGDLFDASRCTQQVPNIAYSPPRVLCDHVQAFPEQRNFLDSAELLYLAHGILRPLAKNLQHFLLHEFGLERVRASDGDQFPAIDQANAVAVLGLIHVVGGHKGGDPLAGEFVNQIPELTPADRIHSRGRLVKKDDGRLVQNGASKCEALFPATGEDTRAGMAAVLKTSHLDYPLFALLFLFWWDTIDAAVEIDILLYGEVLVERELLAHVADVGLDLFRLGPHIESRHGSGATRRRQNPGQHADCG